MNKTRLGAGLPPRDILPGANFPDSITKAIKDCKVFVLIHSSNYSQSTFVTSEISYAFENGKTLLPIRIEDVPYSPEEQFLLGRTHWIDAFSNSPNIFDNVANKIKRLIYGSELEPPKKDSNLPIRDSHEKPLVFISYYSGENSRDKIVANTVYAELEANGIKCWMAPNDISPDEDWDEAIVNAIENCQIMVVIFSDNVNYSHHIKTEVLLAADEGLNLITFRIEDAIPKKFLKLQLNKKQWADAFTEPLDTHIQKLVKTVESSIDQINSPNPHHEEPEVSEYTIELNYKPISSEEDPLIEGNVRGAVGESVTGFQIEFLENTSQWRSSKWGLTAEGAFMTRVHAEPGRTNEFKIILTDYNGNTMKIIPDCFPYTIISENKKEYPQRKPLVFICHSHKDKTVADAVCAKLEQEKIRCWIAPRDVSDGPSATWAANIIDAINRSNLMVLIFSKNSQNSNHVYREVERAVNKGLDLIPLRIEDIFPAGDMEYFLSVPHWIDAFEPPLEKHIQILTKKVKTLLEAEKNFHILENEEYETMQHHLNLQNFVFDENSVDIEFNDIFLNNKESLLEDFESSYLRQIESLTKKIVVKGRSFIHKSLPMGRFGDLIEVNPLEIENYQNMSNIIINYLKNENPQKPLSIAVFGPPSSGKSYVITQIIESIAKNYIDKLYFDVSLFNTASDLVSALQKVRAKVLEGKIPLVFFDEFDSPFGDAELGWLKHFLNPMQYGEFRDGDSFYTIGRCIFVFTGVSSTNFRCFSREEFDPNINSQEIQQNLLKFRTAKGTDFISRLRGYLNISGLNPCNEEDNFFTLRRAVVFRSLLERKAPNIIDKGKIHIDPGVLSAFINIPYYKHGMRSMEAIIDMSMLSDANKYGKSTLPAVKQLEMHVDAEIFHHLMVQDTSGDIIEKIAIQIHEKYRETQKGYRPLSDPIMQPWEDLDEKLKKFNLDQAKDITNKLKAFHYGFKLFTQPPTDLIKFKSKELEEMAIMEHKQWCRDRTNAGWTFGPKRDDELKTSPYLVPWNELTEEVKEWDREAVRNIPEILKKAGFEIYSLK